MKMNTTGVLSFVAGALLMASLALAAEKEFTSQFNVAGDDWTSTGGNAYFMLDPGYTLEFEGKEDGKLTHLVITVLDETLKLDGVETRVVEERETVNGHVVEVSRNYFAASKKTGDVYYFGEDVDMYRNGKVTGHGGSWRAGKDGAKYGLMMPAKPQVGDRFYQELAGDVARDRVEIVSVTETLTTKAGKFTGCVKTEETTPLEPGAKDYKIFCAGIGLVKDGALSLTKHGKR